MAMVKKIKNTVSGKNKSNVKIFPDELFDLER